MISIIIPTLNGERYIDKLFTSIREQRLEKLDQEMELIVVDSESTDDTLARVNAYAKELRIKTITVPRAEFDHGGTRNRAWQESLGEYVFFLTQDALPANPHYLSQMIGYLEGEKGVVMVSGRQIPYEDAKPVERLTRAFNYPKESFYRDASDIARLGIKAYFFSDACALYRRSFLEEMGGFESPIPTNEDMLMAARALKRGYKIGYCGSACVYHSHNFTLAYQYRRNFDVAAFLTMYADEIQSGGTTGEGIRMVIFTEKELLKRGHILSCFRCVLESGAKFLGNRAGKRYKDMTREQILKKTSNPTYWKRML